MRICLYTHVCIYRCVCTLVIYRHRPTKYIFKIYIYIYWRIDGKFDNNNNITTDHPCLVFTFILAFNNLCRNLYTLLFFLFHSFSISLSIDIIHSSLSLFLVIWLFDFFTYSKNNNNHNHNKRHCNYNTASHSDMCVGSIFPFSINKFM